jgi:hypothetical protein
VKVTLTAGTSTNPQTFILSSGVGEDQPADFQMTSSRSTQVIDGLRWNEVKVFDRLNEQTVIKFQVTKTYSTVYNSTYERLRAASLLPRPARGVVRVFWDDGASRYIWLKDAVVEPPVTQQLGVYVTTYYTIRGGRVRTNPNDTA